MSNGLCSHLSSSDQFTNLPSSSHFLLFASMFTWIRKISISDSDEDSSSSESSPSTRSRLSRLRITDDVEEEGLHESTKNEVEMSTSAVMSSTSLLEETPEVESFDSEVILADIRKKRTASPTFDPSLPGPSGYGQITCAELVSP
ncbi:hypothetical protein CEXT_395551 [Caerostris extrusa]|uniref:Uncharacterized protein n=1 Tax=Caerostris extrusa TaxID=172846 RepID=A0AAV4TDP7_CAEEX|nr:hypothetical protein CEXT_395551 [Caerostris extrusa]